MAGHGGVKLSVRVHGGSNPDAADTDAAAPALLLHHGLASSQRIWDLMVPRLRRRFRVVTYDARGHGRSRKPTRGYGFDSVVADARAVIRATDLRHPIVVGHSWGASVALELAARAPRSVGGVILVDGGLLSPRDKMDWPTAKRELAPPHIAGMPLAEFRRMIPTFFDGALEVTPEVEAIVLSVMLVDRRERIRPRLSRANHLRIVRALWLRDPDEALARLSVPGLAVLARSDEAASVERRSLIASRLRRTAPPIRITWLRGIHDLPLQRPDVLAGRIERFADQLVR